MQRTNLLNLKELKLEQLPEPLDHLLSPDAFKLPECKQEAKHIDPISLPNGYTIPRSQYLELYGKQHPVWNYKIDDSKETKELDTKLYEQQFHLLVDAIKLWGQTKLSTNILSNLDTLKANFFQPDYSGYQSSHYFIAIKQNLEKIWYVITRSDTLPEKIKISELKNLCEKIGLCNSGVFTYICDTAFQLTKNASLDFLLAEMRKNITDAYAVAYRTLNHQQIHLGNEVHISTALYSYSKNHNWGPLVDITKIIEKFGAQLTLVDADVLTNFHQYFESSYTPKAILNCISTHFQAELTSYKNLLAIKEDKEGWIEYNQEFIDKISALAKNIHCEWTDFFEQSEDYKIKFNNSLFKPIFLKMCLQKEKLFQRGQWRRKELPQGFTIYWFPELSAWLETPDGTFFDYDKISKGWDLTKLYLDIKLSDKYKLLEDHIGPIKYFIRTGADLINLLTSNLFISRTYHEKYYLGIKYIAKIMAIDPAFFPLLTSKPADCQWIKSAIIKGNEEFLFVAANYGNVAMLKFLIEDKTLNLNIKAINDSQSTLVHIASKHGHADFIRALAEYKEVNLNDLQGDKRLAPIHAAAYGKHANVIKALHESKANINILNDKDETAASIAAKQGDLATLKVLVTARADMTMAIQAAVMNGQIDVFRFLVGIDSNLINIYHHTSHFSLAHMAAASKHQNSPRIIAEIQKINSQINSKANSKNITPLSVAVENLNWNNIVELLNYDTDWKKILVRSVEATMHVIQKLGEAKANFNLVDKAGNTFLHVIAGTKQYSPCIPEVAKWITDFRRESKNSDTPIQVAIKKNSHFSIKYFKIAKADFTIKNSQGISALGNAVNLKKWDMVATMLNLSDIEYVNGHYVLLNAILKANVEAIKALLPYIDLNHPDEKLGYPIFTAIKSKNINIVKPFLEFGIHLNLIQHNTSIAREAIFSGSAAIIELLLEYKVDFTQKEEMREDSVLQSAAYTGCWNLVSLILKLKPLKQEEQYSPLPITLAWRKDVVGMKTYAEHNLDLNLRDLEGNTALHIAAEFDDLNMVAELVKHNISFTPINKAHQTPLQIALENQHNQIVALLLKLNPLSPDETDVPLLRLAVMRANFTAISMLETHKVFQDEQGNTPLHLAVIFEQIKFVRILASENHDLLKPNLSGETPLSLAIGKQRHDLVEALLQMSMPILIEKNDTKTIKKIAEHKVDFNFDLFEIIDAKKPIHLAALSGKAAVLRVLLDNGGNLNCITKQGRGILYFALLGGNLAVFKLLLEQNPKIFYNSSDVLFRAVISGKLDIAIIMLLQTPGRELNEDTIKQLNIQRDDLTNAFCKQVTECKDPELQQKMLLDVIQGDNGLSRILNTPTNNFQFQFTNKTFQGKPVTGSIYKITQKFTALLTMPSKNRERKLEN